jgi:uncharacterized protein
LNTASKQVLAYVSGLGPQLAQNIINYRNENGAFKNRESLKKVPRLGDKAFEQAAGFLRIRDGAQVLDASGVHPERYALINKMARDLGCSVDTLLKDVQKQKEIKLQQYVSDEVGLPTLTDIMNELAKPGRDPREQFEIFSFTDGVNEIADLKVGMKLPGIVTNITNFGAFVDIGVHQDGLVHTSQISDKYVANPNELVKVHQKVEVTVVEVDVERKRISLSMKKENPGKADKPKSVKQQQKPKFKPKPHGERSTGGKPFVKKPEIRKEKALPEGDLQMKLAALKDKFK